MAQRFFPILIIMMLTACESRMRKLTHDGAPPLSPLHDPMERAHHLEDPSLVSYERSSQSQNNSLWQEGSRSFFKDQRACRRGDILKVRVSINDKGSFESGNKATRQSQTHIGIPHLGGWEKKILDRLPSGAMLAPLVNTTSQSQSQSGSAGGGGGSNLNVPAPSQGPDAINTQGTAGKIGRSEVVQFMIPVRIMQILPNGYFVIQGSQNIRLGIEMRCLSVQGILRPNDIDMENIAPAERLTEARILYGGQGDITQAQTQPYGARILQALNPLG